MCTDKRGVQLESNLKNNGTWSAATWPTRRQRYRPAIFFRHLCLIVPWSQPKEKCGALKNDIISICFLLFENSGSLKWLRPYLEMAWVEEGLYLWRQRLDSEADNSCIYRWGEACLEIESYSARFYDVVLFIYFFFFLCRGTTWVVFSYTGNAALIHWIWTPPSCVYFTLSLSHSLCLSHTLSLSLSDIPITWLVSHLRILKV